MTQANDKWRDSSTYTYVDVDYDGESESVSSGYHIEAIVSEAERRGYERAMEEVKKNSELPTPQEERDFYRYIYSKSALSQPACLHDGCTNCQGRGVDSLGRLCVHAISCPCSKHNVVC